MQRVRTRGLPIVIIAGGGYTRTAASVVAHSLLNLYHLGLISGPSTGLYCAMIDDCNYKYWSMALAGAWALVHYIWQIILHAVEGTFFVLRL